MKKISVAIATFNEAENIGPCLESVRQLADEIVVVDGRSQDKTVAVAKKHGAKVIVTDNPPLFHLNKQKALEACQGEWILQLDADERVTPELVREIKKIVSMNDHQIEEYQKTLPQRKLFLRHQKMIEKRDGKIGQNKDGYVGFFLPRLNYFLGKYLRYGGVYPDGVIRLVKKTKARFPCQSVHEQIMIDGQVGWLQNDLIHLADPTFKRYLQRNSRYIDLMASDFQKEKIGRNPIQMVNYFFLKPTTWFFWTLMRHKGILDGFQGVIFSFFSALRFPRAYWRYWFRKGNEND
jgi:glycosyltransferase involved in cell wall biosynthesis